MYIEDTIAAVSTPCGEGGIAIIRISGADSLRILDSLYRPSRNGGFDSHRFYYGTVKDPNSDITLDEIMCVYMKAPRTFTREDVVEIHCHGGTLVVQLILAAVLACGARLAQPGEFTKRAFLNGRVDLVQAEATIDIIRAKTSAAVTLAQNHREGFLSSRIIGIRDSLRQILALLEAYIDFPDEDLGDADTLMVKGLAESALSISHNLLESYQEGRVLRDGISVIIAGKPNAGKSSLLNTLLSEKRAIVTSLPGTTRDIIEEVVSIRGLPVRLLDTAGICVSDDPVESEGISRALARIPSADLVIILLDGSRPFDQDDVLSFEAVGDIPHLMVVNKSDLPALLVMPEPYSSEAPLFISTSTGEGVETLKGSIADLFLHGRLTDNRDLAFLSDARHRDVLQKVVDTLSRFSTSLDEAPSFELLAIDLRDALDALGQITGETTPDDILGLIFDRFCIGK
ncbi:MAG TPA: tRNA uridine-5-carboxymethylaminomethyl(34) synthesis GTPase MnmE [Geobacteraceae bacterium]|nr:tRNA uridine-5-carboxymethylaminomethyl(34) synthesis GTPase MnmE [Geobacteraceae bacterium]